MAYTTYKYMHKSPEFYVQFAVDKSTKKCKLRIYKTNSSHYEYTFEARIICGDTTVVSLSTSSMDYQPYNTEKKWTDSKTANGTSVKLQIKCGDSGCSNSWGGSFHTVKTITLTKSSDTYNNNSSGDFTINYNTTNSLRVWVTSANIATLTKTTTSGSTTTTTTRNATGAEFAVSVATKSLTVTEFEDSEEIYTTFCSTDNGNFTIGPNGEWLALLIGLSANTGYCFQLWYTDDELDNYKLLKTHWYATSCMPSLSASAGTSIISISASSGAWAHTSKDNGENGNNDIIRYKKVIINTSSTATKSDFDSIGIAEGTAQVDGSYIYSATYYNYTPGTYYVHIIKCNSDGSICDENTITTAKVQVGYVVINSVSNVSGAIDGANIKINVTGKIYNPSTTNYDNSAVSTSNTDYWYTFDSNPYAENVNWTLIGTGVTSGDISPIFIPLPSPHITKTIYVLYRELNTDKNTPLSQSITSILVASNVNVVRIKDKYAIPLIYDGTSKQWKKTKALVRVNGAWHNTIEAHYNHSTGKWEV